LQTLGELQSKDFNLVPIASSPISQSRIRGGYERSGPNGVKLYNFKALI